MRVFAEKPEDNVVDLSRLPLMRTPKACPRRRSGVPRGDRTVIPAKAGIQAPKHLLGPDACPGRRSEVRRGDDMARITSGSWDSP